MEQRIAKVLLDRGDGEPLTTVQIMHALSDPSVRKSDVNRVLYKCARTPEDPANALALPHALRLCRIEPPSGAPRWAVYRKAELHKHYADDVRVAWAVYELAAQYHNARVHISVLEPKHVRELALALGPDTLNRLLSDHILAPGEVMQIGADWKFTLACLGVTRAPVALDCDTIIGPRRDLTHAIMLGMAILECVNANPGKKVLLETKIPGNAALLRSVFKASSYARTLDIEITLAVPPPLVPECTEINLD